MQAATCASGYQTGQWRRVKCEGNIQKAAWRHRKLLLWVLSKGGQGDVTLGKLVSLEQEGERRHIG